MYILICGLEYFALQNADVKSLDFAAARFSMKLIIKSANIDVINECRWHFDFQLSSEILVRKCAKCDKTFAGHTNLYRYFGIHVV